MTHAFGPSRPTLPRRLLGAGIASVRVDHVVDALWTSAGGRVRRVGDHLVHPAPTLLRGPGALATLPLRVPIGLADALDGETVVSVRRSSAGWDLVAVMADGAWTDGSGLGSVQTAIAA